MALFSDSENGPSPAYVFPYGLLEVPDVFHTSLPFSSMYE